jgi:hypothetical protein
VDFGGGAAEAVSRQGGGFLSVGDVKRTGDVVLWGISESRHPYSQMRLLSSSTPAKCGSAHNAVHSFRTACARRGRVHEMSIVFAELRKAGAPSASAGTRVLTCAQGCRPLTFLSKIHHSYRYRAPPDLDEIRA